MGLPCSVCRHGGRCQLPRCKLPPARFELATLGLGKLLSTISQYSTFTGFPHLYPFSVSLSIPSGHSTVSEHFLSPVKVI
jgi:hypothetical protein